ncbi:unnamed protein product [Anisakis simplex]|uniref:Riboflavin transporter n=1 Tax=Anisakis simplex TaxID=6269 RepID=A0A0M3K5I9_ANISI|nr:unnamed protein product [Anisakis simplex]
MFLADCVQHVAVAAFGMGSWLSVNAVYVQLPLLIYIVPEGWNLATYIVLLVQIACIAPLIYGILDILMECISNKTWKRYNQMVLIPIMLVLSGFGLLMAAFTYDQPVVIDNAKHSYWLFVAILIMSIPCTTADVLFLPYITKLENFKYVTTFFIGMGLSALLPSTVSLIQGASANLNGTVPNAWGSTEGSVLFGPRSYLVIMVALTFVSLLEIAVSFDLSDRLEDTRRNEKCQLFKLLEFTRFENFCPNIYFWSTLLTVMMNPIFCFLQFCIAFKNTCFFIIWASVSFALVAFAFTMALVGKVDGLAPVLLVVFGLSSGLISWERTAIAQILRQTSTARGLFWCGAFTQIGSFIGALTMFVLTEVVGIFRKQ